MAFFSISCAFYDDDAPVRFSRPCEEKKERVRNTKSKTKRAKGIQGWRQRKMNILLCIYVMANAYRSVLEGEQTWEKKSRVWRVDERGESHKTSACVLIYVYNFSVFLFFLLASFCLWMPLVQSTTCSTQRGRPGRDMKLGGQNTHTFVKRSYTTTPIPSTSHKLSFLWECSPTTLPWVLAIVNRTYQQGRILKLFWKKTPRTQKKQNDKNR